MAPRKPGKMVQFQASESEEESQEDALQKAKNIISKFNSNRDSTREVIEDEYEKHAGEVGRKIDKLVNGKRSKVTKSQKASWDKLDALNKKRQALETIILTSMKTVEVHTSNLTSELNAMFDGRIDELDESSTQQGE